jgi:hypothetical protein
VFKLTGFVLLCVFFTPAALADLVEIKAASYLFDKQTDVGSYSYHDDTGNQLNDGIYGNNTWHGDLGSGRAYEWVAWNRDERVMIDFVFGATHSFDRVQISTIQDILGNVVLPSAKLWQMNANGEWGVVLDRFIPQSADNNNSGKFYINFDNLNLVADTLRIELYESNGNSWMFTDEISFYQTQSQQTFDQQRFNAQSNDPINVPSPLLMSAFAMALAIKRKRVTPV